METEIWPNLYAEAARKAVPILLANARISQDSFPAYLRLKPLIRLALKNLTRVSAQSESDASRWRELGVEPERIEIGGNLKYDVSLPASLQQQANALRNDWGVQRAVVVAGSTHEDDEGPLLEAFQGVLKGLPNTLLVVVPRHPERFGRAAEKAGAAGFTVHRFSQGGPCPPETHCLVVDAMGELMRCYAAADVTFVGGSLHQHGGQNLLEPAALGIPIVIGPHTFNFAEISAGLLACGGARLIHSAAELEAELVRLLTDADLRQAMGQSGQAWVKAGQGALLRTLDSVDELLNQSR